MEPDTADGITIAGRTVIPVADSVQYAHYAERIDNAASPLPVLADAWQRFTASCATLPTSGAAVGSVRRHWQGTVFVCDPEYAAVGHVLARGTSRSLRVGTFSEAVELSRGTPVTVVAGISVIGPEALGSIPTDAQLGLFAARSLAAASSLAVRTLINGPAVAAALDDLFIDALSPGESTPGRLVGQEASPGTLRSAIGDGVAVLAVSGHGRDCLMHLNGGGICGRAEERPLLQVLPAVSNSWSEHPTACQQGEGCWRGDISMEQHLPASQVRAALVVLDSCRTAVAGRAAVRTDVSLPLAMLEGTALAVVAGAGTRGGFSTAGELFQALVRTGFSLGQALSEANGAIAENREALGKLVLFGDAGLVPAPAAADAPLLNARPLEQDAAIVEESSGAVLVAGRDLIPAEATGPLPVARKGEDSSWVLTSSVRRSAGMVVKAPPQLRQAQVARAREWLNNLSDLDGMGLKPNHAALRAIKDRVTAAVRARVGADHLGAAKKAVAAFDSALDELSRVQERLVADETEWISSSFYSISDGWPRPWETRSDTDLSDCPQCGAETVVKYRIQTGAGVGEPLCFLDCVRCAEVDAGTAEFAPRVTVQMPAEVRRGGAFTVRITVVAPFDRPLSVSLGAAIANEQLLHCTLTGTRSFQLAPGERQTVEFNGGSDASQAKPDLKPVKVLVAADGALRCLTRNLWLRT